MWPLLHASLHPSHKPVPAKAKVQNQKCVGTFPSLDRYPAHHPIGQSQSPGPGLSIQGGEMDLPLCKRSHMPRGWGLREGEEPDAGRQLELGVYHAQNPGLDNTVLELTFYQGMTFY